MVIELPLNLQIIAPAHQPNWDLVSDLVSSNYSRLYRSPLDCRKRFENVILKREELCLAELHNKKQQQQQQQVCVIAFFFFKSITKYIRVMVFSTQKK